MITASEVTRRLASFWPGWQVGRRLGEGAHGTVFAASRGTEEAAVKVIQIPQHPSEVASFLAEGGTEETARVYFREFVDHYTDEIRIMEKLRDAPNVVQIDDYRIIAHTDEIGWDIYIRMELLVPVTDFLSSGRVEEAEAIRLGCDICRALSACESYKIIHRDIKPENILVTTDGTFKLGDFGVARNLERRTAALSQKGTYNYMAPEVVRGESYTGNVDIYSLGIVLFRLLNNNRLPFTDPYKQLLTWQEREEALTKRLQGEQIPDPVQASPAMAAVIRKACRYDPRLRYQKAGQMLEDLRRVQKCRPGDEKAQKKILRTLEREEKAPVLRRRIAVILLGAALFGALSGGYLALTGAGEEGEFREEALLEEEEFPEDEDLWEEILQEEEFAQEDDEEAAAQVLTLSDPVIEAAVREQLQLEEDEELTAAAADRLTDLMLDNAGITDLLDLALFPKLQSLSLEDNEIQELTPLAQLQELTDLRLDNNQIEDLAPLSGLPMLTSLSLSGNQITDLTALAGEEGDPVRDSLESLVLADNPLEGDLSDLSLFPHLNLLNLENTSPSSFEWLTSLNEMQSLNLVRTGFTQTSLLTALTELETLDAGSCGLRDLTALEALTNLKALRLTGNQIKDITPLTALGTLEDLSLESNQIEDLTPLSKLTQIRNLTLSANRIRDISPLAPLEEIETLELQQNQITDISVLSGMTHLVYLDLSENQITDASVMTQLPKLEYLRISRNPIEDYTPLEKLGITMETSPHISED